MVLAVLSISGCALSPLPSAYAPPVAVADRPGGAIAAYRCAACHAVEGRGPGYNRLAPAFRDLNKRYDPATLAAVLQRVAVQGHGQMPPYQFAPGEVELLAAYIRSVR